MYILALLWDPNSTVGQGESVCLCVCLSVCRRASCTSWPCLETPAPRWGRVRVCVVQSDCLTA
jgi:hypothetical protein